MILDQTDKEILNYLIEGAKVKEVGPKINLASKTIEGRILRAKKKNHCRTLVELIAKYVTFAL